MADAPPLVVVAGATATGKTELGIRLAEAFIAEGRPATVISADSRQVYRGLDIGTAKVGAADRARVPHAGLDLVDPPERFALADFVAHARGVLAGRGRDATASRCSSAARGCTCAPWRAASTSRRCRTTRNCGSGSRRSSPPTACRPS